MLTLMLILVLGSSVMLDALYPDNPAAETAQANPESQRSNTMPPAQDDHDMVSWVVLSDTYVALDVARLRAALDDVFPGEFLPPREQGSFVIEGAAPGQFLIQSSVASAAGTFLLHSVPGPYTEFSDFAAEIDDPALRRKAETQCCWLSVDLIGRHTSDEDAYRFIGRVLAKIAPADAAVLVHPTRSITIAFDGDVRHRLAGGVQP